MNLKKSLKEKFPQIITKRNIAGLIIVLLVLGLEFFVIFKSFDKTAGESIPATDDNAVTLRINEYIVRNKSTFRDERWESPDWIEIFNYGGEPVWLGGMYLSDDLEEPDKYLFPDMELLPGEYLLVLASGNSDADDGCLRAPFKLGGDDEGILLFQNERTIDYREIEYLPADISAGYGADGSFGYFSKPTPGAENTSQIYDTYDIVPENPYEGLLLINEYVSDNSYCLADGEGRNCDWIELYNPNDYAVYLGDIFLSDDENELNKYRLPDIELKSEGYYLVYASGDKMYAENGAYAPFGVSEDDEKLTLTYITGSIIDEIDIYSLNEDTSAGLNKEGNTVFFKEPTPGGENTTEQFITSDISASYLSSSPILINEWMSNNEFGILDEDGDASDWIEIYNPSQREVPLQGYALTDDDTKPFKWKFPDDASIPADGYIIIFMSGKDKADADGLHANFSLSEGEVLYLTEPSAAFADYAVIDNLPGNVSKGRTDEGYGYFSLPTPGKKNTSGYVTQKEEGAQFMPGDVYISEVASGAYQSERYKRKPLYEYIELYNRGEQTVDLSGFSLSDSGGNAFVFAKGTAIEPENYLLIALKGDSGHINAAIEASGLSLNSSGERVLLENSDGAIIDCFETGYLLGSYSSGRAAGNENTRVFFMEKTPGKANSADVFTSYASSPEFSREGGMAGESFELSISAEENSTIYYTANGNMPNENSSVYTEPILIDGDTVIRAVAVCEGKLPSLVETNTYILERAHDIPVVCLTSPPAGLFYDMNGIYAKGEGYGIGEYPYFESNYFWDVERQVSFEYYDENGTEAAEFDAGIQIAGGYTRALAQKSIVVRLRDEYGLSEVEYPFFDEGTALFKHLLLRNGGQEGWKTKICDCFIQNCANELGTVDAKRGRPVALYINGRYWGLYNLRDKLNDEYLSIKYGINQDEISILTEYSSPKKGSNKDWLELKNYCSTHNMSIKENYDYLAQHVDVQAFMDYMIVETFFGNVDTHNINFWKAGGEGAKWKPFLFDMDLSVRGVDYSMVNMYLGRSDLGYDSFVIKSLAKYEGFQKEFIKRYSYILSEVYTEEYLISALESLVNEISNEIVYQIDRWGRPDSIEYWESSVRYLKDGVALRRHEAVQELAEYFNLSDEDVANYFPWYAN